MQLIQKALMVLLIIAAVMVGSFFLIAGFLPAEHHSQAATTVCQEREQVHAAFSEPAQLAEWFFPQSMEATVHADKVRWQDDDRWLELRVLTANAPLSVDYELEQQGRFTLPLQARIQETADGGSDIHLSATASAESAIGRWMLATPNILARLGLPHETLEQAMGRGLAHAENYLDERHGECPSP